MIAPSAGLYVKTGDGSGAARCGQPGNSVSAFLNVRVADITAFYEQARERGARFLTESIDRKAEIRCYMHDPDDHLIEIGQATGILHGVYADPTADATGGQP